MKVYFDSRNLSCKNPFGAVRTQQEVQFNIQIYNDIYVHCVYLLLTNGGRYPFSYCYSENQHSFYTLNMQFPKADVYFYHFEIETECGVFIGKNNSGKLILDDSAAEWQLTVYDAGFTVPEWAKGTIMYQIFPDRFAKSEKFQPLPAKNERKVHTDWNAIPEFIYQKEPYRANDYFGGNLKGIIERLDDLKALGIGLIYLNPVFESAENHRYSTGDYKTIDPYLGTNEDFVQFSKVCKKKGIRVILDGVFSHTGADSMYFNQYGHYPSVGAYNSQESPYYSWYSFRKFPEEYESWWGFRNLPNVKEDNEAYLDFITNPETGILKHWHDMGIDGWRLDVVDELPDIFIDKLRQTVKKLNPEAFIIGEVWEDASNKESYGIKRRYLLGNQLDSVMNYPFRAAIIDYVKTNQGDKFSETVMQILENYPEDVLLVLMNPLGTHDTKRILTELGVDRDIRPEEQGAFRMTAEEYQNACELVKLAVVLQFTLPGIPSVYYGDEVGLEGFADPYCRKTYPYGKEDASLLDFYRNITGFHQKYRSEFSDRLTQIQWTNGILHYCRGTLQIYMNAGNEAQFLRKNITETLVSFEKNVAYNEYGLILPPKSFAIFKGEQK